ncbi:MAG: hypothetical protein F6J94_18710 [Moorea sp. SIO1F2]|uniref:Uncharacterized protein n=1 Tax=Moorena bouillonii PNG TaxID=568701 RepID=A0A1U7N6L9_9CYAN|nr:MULTISPECIES: hypothetical protein [Moorena]NEN96252.1 hypothetical protein [Moorena sp. SIO3I7]NEO05243.1 hypothetical protein [Moorena sp. SIO3I8]NEO20535.1 hypothetical protein [Moorena sp. SIO4A5]NEP20790.1 hypothetical protein [Moorena sp. SIO3I6]NEQ57874.1 hypothetical protein [Moorena sp. SIO4A1]
MQSYQKVLGKYLPFEQVFAALKTAAKKGMNAFSLPDTDPIKAKLRLLCKEALTDQGMGVISIGI